MNIPQPTLLDSWDGSAVIEGDYRYLLTRQWQAGGGTALWVMLNPSTADAMEDDPTIRRCIGFSKREGCGSLAVVNLYALRTTRPVHLTQHPNPMGPKNEAIIMKQLHDRPSLVIAAWGAWPTSIKRRPPHADVFSLAQSAGIPLMCLGTTKAGAPKHPLYLPLDAPLTPFREEL